MSRARRLAVSPIDPNRPCKGFFLAVDPSEHELGERIFACGRAKGQTLDDVTRAFHDCIVRSSPWLDGAKVRVRHSAFSEYDLEDELAPMSASLSLAEHKIKARRMNIADLPGSLSAHAVVHAVNDLLRTVEAPLRFGVVTRWRDEVDDYNEGNFAVLRVADDERAALAALGYQWEEPFTPAGGEPTSLRTRDADRELVPRGKIRRRESGSSLTLAEPAVIHGFLCPAGTEVGLEGGRVDGVLFRAGVQVGDVALARLSALRRMGTRWVADGVLVGTARIEGVSYKAPTELLVTADGVVVVRRRRPDEESWSRDLREAAELEEAIARRGTSRA